MLWTIRVACARGQQANTLTKSTNKYSISARSGYIGRNVFSLSSHNLPIGFDISLVFWSFVWSFSPEKSYTLVDMCANQSKPMIIFVSFPAGLVASQPRLISPEWPVLERSSGMYKVWTRDHL